MQITSAMVSAAAKESTRCDYSNAPLCRKNWQIITKPSATLDGGGEFTTNEIKVLVVSHFFHMWGFNSNVIKESKKAWLLYWKTSWYLCYR
jgi:hypothetical protein